ncbi:MAG: HNH endonuclease [Parafilimonas terrae]|nr:HNH endonuclease [Parafilimonas terrae]
MSKCLLCPAEITAANDSAEHLIPNAIGGRRKVSGLLCKTCNSETGRSWDAALGDQLLPLTLLFDVSRQRKSAERSLAVTTTAGERITIGPGGKLTLSAPAIDRTPVGESQTSYRLVARTMEEARQMVQGLKRKHPEIDVEAALKQAQAVETYLQGTVCHDLGFGGELAGRSVVKSCLAMAFSSGIPIASCEAGVKYLLDADAEPCFGFHQRRELVTGRVAGTPFHCLAVRANPQSGLVLAYAEYFGCRRVVACLGERYDGPSIEMAYAIDPRDGREIPLSVDLPFDPSEVRQIYDYEHACPEFEEQAIGSVIAPVIDQSREAEYERVRRNAWIGALEACGAKAGDELTDALRLRLSREIAERITPFLLNQISPTQRNN